MAKRTTQTGLNHWEDTEDLSHIVKDKRTGKRGTPAKARRRNRRYENRILRSQSLEEAWEDELPDDEEKHQETSAEALEEAPEEAPSTAVSQEAMILEDSAGP